MAILLCGCPEDSWAVGDYASLEDAAVSSSLNELSAGTRLRGYLTFAPDYATSNGNQIGATQGQIPINTEQDAPLPYLFVCAMDRDGDFDPAPYFGEDEFEDDVLGCGRADVNGYYDFALTASGNEDANLYLTTWFCDDADEAITVFGGATTYPARAAVCVRLNSPPSGNRHRKFLRSPEYAFTDGAVNYINWNLSCPSRTGSATSSSRVACPSVNACTPGTIGCEEPTRTGATHSATGWNKESVHVFRSAIETVKTFGNLVPKTSEVATTGCGSAGNQACIPCDNERCLSEISLYIKPATVAGDDPNDRPCSAAGGGSSADGWETICISHPSDAVGSSATLNPYRPAHEIGHILHKRWMKEESSLHMDCGAINIGWAAGASDTLGTAEGFANFIAVASWFNSDMGNMMYDGYDVEGASDAALRNSCGPGNTCTCAEGDLLGEGRPTQFFVDLWDADDSISLSVANILRIWSTFDQLGEAYECGPDGRNLEDFRARYNVLRSSYGWPTLQTYDAVAGSNCVDRHSNTTAPPKRDMNAACGVCCGLFSETCTAANPCCAGFICAGGICTPS